MIVDRQKNPHESTDIEAAGISDYDEGTEDLMSDIDLENEQKNKVIKYYAEERVKSN